MVLEVGRRFDDRGSWLERGNGGIRAAAGCAGTCMRLVRYGRHAGASCGGELAGMLYVIVGKSGHEAGGRPPCCGFTGTS